MKLTKTGFRISKKGTIIESIERDAITSVKDLGKLTKVNGTYYYFERKQGNVYVYLT